MSKKVHVHADGGDCHGTPLVDGRCPGCGIVPDVQSTELWPMAEVALRARIANKVLLPARPTPEEDLEAMLDGDRTSRVTLFGGPVVIEVKHLKARRLWLVFVTCSRCCQGVGASLESPTLVVTQGFLEDAIKARQMLAMSVVDEVERHVHRRNGACKCTWSTERHAPRLP